MNILEIGTYTGYSACLCEGMQENGILHTIDIKEELVDFKESILKSPGKRRSYNT
jgi:predicted O-methyltransferase YrrM